MVDVAAPWFGWEEKPLSIIVDELLQVEPTCLSGKSEG
jgi:hypothetical protein